MDGSGGSDRLGRIARLVGLSVICLALANCASTNVANRASRHSHTVATATISEPTHKLHRFAHSRIFCDQRGCSDRVRVDATAVQNASYASVDYDGKIVGHRPYDCPHSFCGCEASRYVFGKVRPELNLASNWFKFPRTAPAPGMAAVRNHHVMVLMSPAGGNEWLVHDGNSGGGLTREHVMPLYGYVIVNPHGT